MQDQKEEIVSSDGSSKVPKSKQVTFVKSLSFVMQFGFMIVIPLVIFAFAGKWLANHYNNQIFLYLGLILALLTSSVWFYHRINSLYKDFIN